MNDAVDDMVKDAVVSPSVSAVMTSAGTFGNDALVAPNDSMDNSGVMDMLARYLPIIANELAEGSRIEFNDDNLFKLVRRKNSEYMKMNGGMSALA